MGSSYCMGGATLLAPLDDAGTSLLSDQVDEVVGVDGRVHHGRCRQAGR
jgi:hypothetical protein